MTRCLERTFGPVGWQASLEAQGAPACPGGWEMSTLELSPGLAGGGACSVGGGAFTGWVEPQLTWGRFQAHSAALFLETLDMFSKPWLEGFAGNCSTLPLNK